jgi:hypothetical protein
MYFNMQSGKCVDFEAFAGETRKRLIIWQNAKTRT